jgi:hypothetical protein
MSPQFTAFRRRTSAPSDPRRARQKAHKTVASPPWEAATAPATLDGMMIYKFHRNTLEDEARNILEECRVMVPGILALVGFQVIAFFNTGFYDHLDADVRVCHLAATGLMLVSVFLLLTPASYHRLAEPGVVSNRFVESATRLLCWAMAFLRLGLAAESFVVTRSLGVDPASSAGVAAFFFLLSWGLWSVYPRVSVLRLAPNTKSD